MTEQYLIDYEPTDGTLTIHDTYCDISITLDNADVIGLMAILKRYRNDYH